jgi:lipopolysaccharide transport system permease protein
MSALTAKYRDLVHVMSLLIQIWMYATPVILPLSAILQKCPARWQWLIALNPMIAVVESFRLMLLGAGTVNAFYLITSAAMTLIILAAGLLLFGKVEKTFVDLV